MDLKKDILFSQLTTLEIGGPIKDFVEVKTEGELLEILKSSIINPKSLLIIGGGSNLLVSDQGFDGLVIKNNIIGIEEKDGKFIVKSGTSLQEFVDLTIEKGFSGLHKLTGIPGSVGGALFGNAGAFGQTISDCLIEIKCFNPVIASAGPHSRSGEKQSQDLENEIARLPDGQATSPKASRNDDISLVESHNDQGGIFTLSKEHCEFEYRDSGFKRNNYTILEAVFKLQKEDPQVLKQESTDVLERRQKKYPPGVKCPGSFFKNLFIKDLPKDLQKRIPPERDYFGKVPAWYFLDEVGAKGSQKGQIKIAEYHGNLFINLGGGSAEDFYNLAKEYFLKVKEKFGIELDPEVQLINLPNFN